MRSSLSLLASLLCGRLPVRVVDDPSADRLDPSLADDHLAYIEPRTHILLNSLPFPQDIDSNQDRTVLLPLLLSVSYCSVHGPPRQLISVVFSSTSSQDCDPIHTKNPTRSSSSTCPNPSARIYRLLCDMAGDSESRDDVASGSGSRSRSRASSRRTTLLGHLEPPEANTRRSRRQSRDPYPTQAAGTDVADEAIGGENAPDEVPAADVGSQNDAELHPRSESLIKPIGVTDASPEAKELPTSDHDLAGRRVAFCPLESRGIDACLPHCRIFDLKVLQQPEKGTPAGRSRMSLGRVSRDLPVKEFQGRWLTANLYRPSYPSYPPPSFKSSSRMRRERKCERRDPPVRA